MRATIASTATMPGARWLGAIAVVAAIAGANGACDRSRKAAPSAGSGAPAVPGAAGEREAAATPGTFYRVDVAPPAPCQRGEACAVELQLTALAGFHVNRDYPFKFVPADGAVMPEPAALVIRDDQTGTLTVRFRPTTDGAASTAHLAGIFKLSVCSADTCKIEEAPIAVDVPLS